MPVVRKFMAVSVAVLGVSAAVRRRRANRASPLAGLISAFGLVITAATFLFVTGIARLHVLLASTAVCVVGFFRERTTRMSWDDGELGLD